MKIDTVVLCTWLCACAHHEEVHFAFNIFKLFKSFVCMWCGCHREMIALYNNNTTDQCASPQYTSFDHAIYTRHFTHQINLVSILSVTWLHSKSYSNIRNQKSKNKNQIKQTEGLQPSQKLPIQSHLEQKAIVQRPQFI